jgi:hypothetical protein
MFWEEKKNQSEPEEKPAAHKKIINNGTLVTHKKIITKLKWHIFFPFTKDLVFLEKL